jgi:transcriptional regulator with XRE-family HTH domain
MISIDGSMSMVIFTPFLDVGSANVQWSLHACEIFHKLPEVGSGEPNNFYKQVGARVRELRGAKLTQEELARASALSRASIVNIEAGRQKLLLHNLFGISKALGVSPTEFIGPLEQIALSDLDLSSAGDAADFVQTALQKLAQQRPRQ